MQNSEIAKRLRRNQTEAEKTFWNAVRSRQLADCKFRRQVPFKGYVLDFVCFEMQIVVEIDGGQHMDSPRDEVRDAVLRSEGFLVKRYWNHEVLNNIEGVMTDLHQALLTLTPALSHKGRGGK